MLVKRSVGVAPEVIVRNPLYTGKKALLGKVHGPFKSICRSGANPEKTLRIRGGAMQVYHHNQ